MVITYLEKIRNQFIEKKIDLNARLSETLIIHKENVEFIKFLEQNTDPNFEAFTPRTVNSFHKKKINELKEEQKSIEIEIDNLKNELEIIEKEIDEVNEVIKEAKKKC
ncbi:MAG: hypothetical protein IJ958_11835 [Agathobacter sp.]|nr:hypothetical protein [Agathobacter sp.]